LRNTEGGGETRWKEWRIINSQRQQYDTDIGEEEIVGRPERRLYRL
jgi:hypothetical protein